MSAYLKPCPFCGATEPIVQVNQSPRGYDMEIICHLGEGGCGARVGWYTSIIKLRNAWNQRVKRVRYEKPLTKE